MTTETIAGTIAGAGAAIVTGVVAAVDTSWPWPAIGVGLGAVAAMNAALIKYVTADLKNTISTEIRKSEERMEVRLDKLAYEMRHEYVRISR